MSNLNRLKEYLIFSTLLGPFGDYKALYCGLFIYLTLLEKVLNFYRRNLRKNKCIQLVIVDTKVPISSFYSINMEM